MPTYQIVPALWKISTDAVSIGKGDPLVLEFTHTKSRVQVLHEVGSEFFPRCQGVYLIQDKVVAVTCLEHMRGGSLHDFRLHIFDLTGKYLHNASMPAIAYELVQTKTHFFLLCYPHRYLRALYRDPILEVYIFQTNTLSCEVVPISAPETLRPFYTNAHVRLLDAKWDISDKGLAVICAPGLDSAFNAEKKFLYSLSIF
ncbi:MAG: hypothetical protein HC912_12530 [Saprospiraceae bacterium]|nr:hypothetical protein [Saprospiraceae bacterium]